MRRLLPILLVAALCVPRVAVAADDAETDEAESTETPESGEAESTESAGKAKRGKVTKRPLPDYDGRDVANPRQRRALWVPRVALAPLYGLWEYGFRTPVGKTVTAIEKGDIPKHTRTLLTMGSGGALLVYPTAMFDFGLRPSIGVSVNVDGPPGGVGRSRIAFAFGGKRWWLFTAKQRFFFSRRPFENRTWTASNASFGFHFEQRPDHVFRGIGSDHGPQTRFFRERLGTEVGLELVFGTLDGLSTFVRAERNRFGPGGIRRNPSIEEEYDVADPRVAPGFETGYQAVTFGGRLALDSREQRPGNGTGARLEPSVEAVAELSSDGFAAIRAGVEAALFADLGGNRVVGVRLWTQIVEPLRSGKRVPFTELVTLGGNEVMRGHFPGWTRDWSVGTATLQYTWPIWVYLDGLVFVETGGGFGRRFDSFDPDSLAMSWGIGVRSNRDRDAGFTALLAFGTTTFGAEDQGIDTVRLVVGTDRGF